MSDVDKDYILAAQTLTAACRMAAIAGLPEAARDRADTVLRGRRWRDPETLIGQITVRAGAQLAAHLVHARLRAAGGSVEDDEGGVAAAVLQTLPALDSWNLGERLQAARIVADVIPYGGDTEPALRAIAALLSRGVGPERDAAAGQLCRQVMADYELVYRDHADIAWWSRHGHRSLVPTAIARAAAAGMVVAGRSKSEVAALAGMSRTTLDKWLREYAEGW